MKKMGFKWVGEKARTQRMIKYMRRRDGQGMVDYVLVICIVAVLAIAAIGPLRDAVLDGIGRVSGVIAELFE